MTQYIIDLGLPTFKPLGLVSAENRNYLLTTFEDPVATMDTVEWKELDSDEKWFQLNYAVDTMVLLHENLLFHGDAFFRNIGFGETGELKIIDPELSTSARDKLAIFERGQQPFATDKEKWEAANALSSVKRVMSTDFTNICNSIDQFILPTEPRQHRPRNDLARLKLYKTVLFEPYRRKISDSQAKSRMLLLSAYDEMMRERKQRAQDGSL